MAPSSVLPTSSDTSKCECGRVRIDPAHDMPSSNPWRHDYRPTRDDLGYFRTEAERAYVEPERDTDEYGNPRRVILVKPMDLLSIAEECHVSRPRRTWSGGETWERFDARIVESSQEGSDDPHVMIEWQDECHCDRSCCSGTATTREWVRWRDIEYLSRRPFEGSDELHFVTVNL